MTELMSCSIQKRTPKDIFFDLLFGGTILALTLVIALGAQTAHAGETPYLRVKTADNATSVNAVTNITVSNGTLTKTGPGSISISTGGGGGSAAWGDITGTLSDQTDLQAALDALVPQTRTVNGHALTGDVTVTPTDLGLVIGTNVQAYSAVLTTYSGINPSANVQTLLGAANYAAFKSSLSLNNVENTALSTWAGSSNITTLGTIGTGVWQGTAVGDTYISSASTWNAKAPAASPTFTGTVTIPTPFTLGATSVTSTGTQLNYLAAATGTTGTNTANVVFSASPTFTGTVTMPTPFTLGATSVTSTGTQLNYLNAATGTTGTTSSSVVFSAGPTLTGTLTFATATSTNTTIVGNPATTGQIALSATGGGSGVRVGLLTNTTNDQSSATAGSKGVLGQANRNTSTGGNTLTTIGVHGSGSYSSSGTNVDVIGVYGTCSKTTSGSGVITDCYSIFGAVPTASGGGTITNSWGIATSGVMGFTSAVGTTPDVNLYRNAADVLRTDDSFQAGGYKSSDGSDGITGAACTSFKNGLCVG